MPNNLLLTNVTTEFSLIAQEFRRDLLGADPWDVIEYTLDKIDRVQALRSYREERQIEALPRNQGPLQYRAPDAGGES